LTSALATGEHTKADYCLQPTIREEFFVNTQVPRGIEVLVKKASVDSAFKAAFLDHPAAAAKEIDLQLTPAEVGLLAATPREQLELVIDRAEVPLADRRAFLGRAAAAMLAALGVVAGGGAAFASEPGTVDGQSSESEQPEGTAKKPPDRAKAIETAVLAIVAGQFNVPPKELKGGATLVNDLHATTSQMVKLRHQLEKQFKLSIPRKDFVKIRTVDEVVGYVKEAVRRRDAASQPAAPNPTRDIQPERAKSGGIRPH
jgi:acyl carrier protein